MIELKIYEELLAENKLLVAELDDANKTIEQLKQNTFRYNYYDNITYEFVV